MFDLWPVYSGEQFRASWSSCYHMSYICYLLQREVAVLLFFFPDSVDSLLVVSCFCSLSCASYFVFCTHSCIPCHILCMHIRYIRSPAVFVLKIVMSNVILFCDSGTNQSYVSVSYHITHVAGQGSELVARQQTSVISLNKQEIWDLYPESY